MKLHTFRFTAATASAVVCALCVSAPLARADEYVDRVNKPLTDIRADHRSDTVLLPLVAKMDPPPAPIADFERAARLPSGAQGWTDAAAWVQKAEQKAVIDKIRAIGADAEKSPAWGFGQPYGVEGVPIELVRAHLYTELGDPPTLAAARFMYLDALTKVELLVHIEAARLTSEGKTDEAIGLLTDWIGFARQIADRQFYREFQWGLTAATRAAARIRDVAYMDSRGKKSLGESAQGDKLPEMIGRLEPDRGVPNVARLRFPRGDRIASEQVIARVYVPRGSVNPATFATTMATLGSSDRPLRLFAESARWQAVAATQKNWFDVNEELPKLYEDWVSRWDLDPYDRRMDAPFYYPRLSSQRSAAITGVIPDMSWLFAARKAYRTEVVGTRSALGVLGFSYANKTLPPTLASIRPRWVKQLDADPFNSDRARGNVPPLEYFVPIRDQPRGDREEAKPHEMNVFIPGGENFSVKFKDDQFILYSVGADGARNWATKVQNTWEQAAGADYLLWPPILSLYRQHMVDTGALK